MNKLFCGELESVGNLNNFCYKIRLLGGFFFLHNVHIFINIDNHEFLTDMIFDDGLCKQVSCSLNYDVFADFLVSIRVHLRGFAYATRLVQMVFRRMWLCFSPLSHQIT